MTKFLDFKDITTGKGWKMKLATWAPKGVVRLDPGKAVRYSERGNWCLADEIQLVNIKSNAYSGEQHWRSRELWGSWWIWWVPRRAGRGQQVEKWIIMMIRKIEHIITVSQSGLLTCLHISAEAAERTLRWRRPAVFAPRPIWSLTPPMPRFVFVFVFVGICICNLTDLMIFWLV